MAESGEKRLLTRRALLKMVALAGGGLAVGFLPRALAELPDAAADARDAVTADASLALAPNAWIRIHGDGRMQLMLARSEMGQGVMTSLSMLLAEELEVGLDQIEILPAPVGPAYVNRLLGEQATGESTSLRDAWTGLREAGALVRVLMIAAAAQRWDVDESVCRAARGRILHADGERSLGYAELASDAARLPLPRQVTLKTSDAWSLIGTLQRRLDNPQKVTGSAGFGLDVRLPGMLYATIERCPVFGSRVRSWRANAAREIAGVVDVLAVRHGIAVIAATTWEALRGRGRLEVKCRPAVNGAADSRRIPSRLRIGLSGRAAVAHSQGDVSLALAEAGVEVEAVYEVPFQAHACMEPMNCTADVGPDHCRLYVPTQSQSGALETARQMTGLPAEKISVHTTFLGGGFERRREQDFVADAVELSMMFGRPVQLIWTREDDIRHDYYRPMTLHRLRGGIDHQGQLSAWFHRVTGPSVLSRLRPAAIRDGIDPELVAGAAELPYPIPNFRVEYRRADTPVPVGRWPGGGHAQNAFVTECFLDELARAAGQEPLALRKALLVNKPRHLEILNLAAERAGWGKPVSAGRALGLALVEAFGSLIAAVAEVSVDGERPLVHRVTSALDCGQVVNPGTVTAQIEAGIAFGLNAAINGPITLTQGRVEQGNFDDYQLLRFPEMPQVEVHLIQSGITPGGVSGLGSAVIAPAVANAFSALTGTPVRALPIRVKGRA